MQFFNPGNLVGLILLGGALLWTVQLVYARRGPAGDDVLRRILSIAGWTMVLVGAVGAVSGPGGLFSLITGPLVLIIAAMAAGAYRESERRALLWALSVAAEKGIPLPHAARSFAAGRADEMGARAARLAEFIEAGAPLPEALYRAGHPLPTDALLAVRLGSASGTLGPALKHHSGRDGELQVALRSLFEKCFYLIVVAIFGVGILTFLLVRIVPRFARLFEEFELMLPEATLWLITVGTVASQYWFLALPLYLFLLLACLVGALAYAGWMPRDLPGLNWFRRRADAALVMRALALAVRQQRSLVETLGMLAMVYPRSSIRSRLRRAGAAIEQGADWCDSLRRVGVIRRADAAVLQAAQRAGNLAWALEEMADSSLRRQAYRLRAALNIVFPLVLLCFGGCVLVIAVALMIPLFQMIMALS